MTLFRNRREAGQQLADKLSAYKDRGVIVLALPRGGVPVGEPVARALHAPLSVLIARKIGSPQDPEFGIGAVAEGGVIISERRAVRALGMSQEDFRTAADEQAREVERRARIYRAGALPELEGKIVILVDDGLATGITTRAALRTLRQMHVQRIVVAIPVCSKNIAARLKKEADEVVCLMSPENFRAVGDWYEDFPQLTDEEVLETLGAQRS